MNQKVYLDNNATTFVDPRVIEVLVKESQQFPGNPSSTHSFGREAKAHLVNARHSISQFLGCQPNEIVFNSGGTEGLNMLIRGLAKGGHIVTSDLEHPAVFATVQAMGNPVTFVKGIVTKEKVIESIQSHTSLLVFMAANNETGVRTDIDAIAAIAKEKGLPLVVDGVALLGKEKIVLPPGVSAMCFSGHKIHAPKGTGFAFVRQNVKFPAQQTGGSQEFSRRGGTENVPGIVALAEAVKLLDAADYEMMRGKRNAFEQAVLEALPFVKINGGELVRTSNTSNLCFEGLDGENLLIQLDRQGIAVSLGSACSSGALEPSRVLLNMGLSMAQARSSLRFSLSRFTTDAELARVVEVLAQLAKKR